MMRRKSSSLTSPSPSRSASSIISCSQCCQLFPKNFRQNGQIIRPLSKKFRSLFVKITSLIPFHQNMTKFLKDLPVPKSVKILEFFMFHMGKIQRKQNGSNIWPHFFRPFLGKFCHRFERPLKCHQTFKKKNYRPLLSYAAEESASWEPCLQLLVSEVLSKLLRYTLQKQYHF